MRPSIAALVLAAVLGGRAAAAPDPVVPDLTGLTREQAVAAVHKAGFADPDIGDADGTTEADDDALEDCYNGTRVGTVCAQTPAAGARAARTASIQLLLGDAATEPVLVMPDLRGMTLAKAAETLAKAGFKKHLDSEFSDDCPAKLVCGQHYRAGKKVRASRYQLVQVGE